MARGRRTNSEQLLQLENRELLTDWFERFESQIKQLGSNDMAKLRNGLSDWTTKYLLPLTRELDLYPLAIDHTLVLLYKQGYFDQQSESGSPLLPTARTTRVHRPARNDVLPLVQRLVAALPAQLDLVNELMRRKICPRCIHC